MDNSNPKNCHIPLNIDSTLRERLKETRTFVQFAYNIWGLERCCNSGVDRSFSFPLFAFSNSSRRRYSCLRCNDSNIASSQSHRINWSTQFSLFRAQWKWAKMCIRSVDYQDNSLQHLLVSAFDVAKTKSLWEQRESRSLWKKNYIYTFQRNCMHYYIQYMHINLCMCVHMHVCMCTHYHCILIENLKQIWSSLLPVSCLSF